jgi:hypothetical protein
MIRISKIILLILLFTLIFGIFSVEIKDPDFWWHLKTGEYIYQTGTLPATDPFAYTSLPKDPTHPESTRIKFVLTQYWLAQVIFYWIYKFLGFQGIIYLRAAILTLLVFLVYRAVRREEIGLYLAMVLLIPLVLLLRTYTGERPQLFSFLLAFLLIYLLEGFRISSFNKSQLASNPQVSKNLNESRHVSGLLFLLPVPVIMLLWANLHGGFILGILIILAYLFSEIVKYSTKRFGKALSGGHLKLLVIFGIVSVVLSLINPNGYNVIPFLLEFEQGPYKEMIIESMSPFSLVRAGFYEPQFIIFFIVMFFCILIFLVNMKRFDLTDFIIITGLSVMSLSASRYIPFFVPVAIVMIARYIFPLLEKLPRMEKFRAMADKGVWPLSVLLLISLIVGINNGYLFKSGIRSIRYPEGAARFLEENRISGNMFNPYVWGGYLIWKLYPDYKVFVDGRGLIGDIFFQEVKIMDAYARPVEGMPEWKALLNAYNVNFILTFSVGNFNGRLVPLIPALLSDPEWHLVYMDNISLIFVRDNPENREILSRFELPKEWLWNEVAVEAALKAKDYPRNINYLITMGDAFLAKRSYLQAVEAYRRAQKINPASNEVITRLQFLRSYGY